MKIGNLPGESNDLATFINENQFFPLEIPAQQLERYCLMQDINGISHLNSPIRIFIRINNLDKIKIEDDNVTVNGSFFLGSTNVGITLTSHGSAISTIEGNISTINSVL